MNCDDEEDCIAGSGSGDGIGGGTGITPGGMIIGGDNYVPLIPDSNYGAGMSDGSEDNWYPGGTDSKCPWLDVMLFIVNFSLQEFFLFSAI